MVLRQSVTGGMNAHFHREGASSVAVEWQALLIRTRDVLGSNLGLETGYPKWHIS
jgi:hypothetical protein